MSAPPNGLTLALPLVLVSFYVSFRLLQRGPQGSTSLVWGWGRHAARIRVLLAQSPKAKERMSSAGDVAARAYAESIVQSAERALESGDSRVCEGLP